MAVVTGADDRGVDESHTATRNLTPTVNQSVGRPNLEQDESQDHRKRRDRDAAGRPRQARPRDALGRPLPYGATGVEPVPEEPLPPDETVAAARSLVDDGRPFSAHEVLEARWKAGPAGERDLWQGLAQICVGLTHAARGRPVGAARLVERGAGRLDAYAASGGPTYGLDLAVVVACARHRALTR